MIQLIYLYLKVISNSKKSMNQTTLLDTNISSKGVDKHLRRQLIARQNKEEKELLLNNPLIKMIDCMIFSPIIYF